MAISSRFGDRDRGRRAGGGGGSVGRGREGAEGFGDEEGEMVEEPPQSNNMPYIIGGIIGGVVLIAVILVIALSGGKEPAKKKARTSKAGVSDSYKRTASGVRIDPSPIRPYEPKNPVGHPRGYGTPGYGKEPGAAGTRPDYNKPDAPQDSSGEGGFFPHQ